MQRNDISTDAVSAEEVQSILIALCSHFDAYMMRVKLDVSYCLQRCKLSCEKIMMVKAHPLICQDIFDLKPQLPRHRI